MRCDHLHGILDQGVPIAKTRNILEVFNNH
jgi:hypothetical protein